MNTAKQRFQWVRQKLESLTTPARELSASSVEQDRARIISMAILFAITIMTILMILEWQFVFIRTARSALIGVSALLYFISRTKYYRIAGYGAITILMAIPVISPLVGLEEAVAWTNSAARSVILSLLLFYVLNTFLETLFFMVGILVALLWFGLTFVPGVDTSALFKDILIISFSVGGLMVGFRSFMQRDYQQALQEIQTREALYQAVVEDQSELICRWRSETRRLTFANRAYRRYFQVGEADLLGRDFLVDVHPEDVALVMGTIRQLTATRSRITSENRTIDRFGDVRWHTWTNQAIYDQAGVLVEMQSIGRDITEAKAAEERLRTSEARYRAIVEDQIELICRWLPDETLTFVNEAYCRFFGKTREEILSLTFINHVHPEDVHIVRANIAQITLEQPTVTYEHRVLFVRGDIYWYQWTDHAFFDDHGKITEYQSVGHDITALKNAQNAEREQRLFAEVMSANAAVMSRSLELNEVLDHLLQHLAPTFPFVTADILLLENGIARISRSTGFYTAEYSQSLLTARLRASQIPNLSQMMASGEPHLISDTHQSLEWVALPIAQWIRSNVAAPIRLEGVTIGFLILNNDIPNSFNPTHAVRLKAFADQAAIAIHNARLYESARRYAGDLESQVRTRTMELELATTRLNAIFESTGEGVFYKEEDVIQFVNTAFCKMMRMTPDTLIGRTLESLWATNAPIEQWQALKDVTDTYRTEGVWRGELTLVRSDGTTFIAGVTGAPIGDIDQTPARSVAVVRDISSEKALADRKSFLLSHASHELRTPITNLKTRLYLLQRRPDLIDKHLDVLETVVGRMQYLVENLLDISRLERGSILIEPRRVDLMRLLTDIVIVQHLEAAQKQITLTAHLPEVAILIMGDEQRLIQVMTNLVTNAINYTPNGGKVSITVMPSATNVVISVCDTGIGIPVAALPHIFEPFFRVDKESRVQGSGLGLSIVKEIVDLHHGEITVQSQLSHGSCFKVTLPLTPETP